jgi:hypothetical protein
MALFGRESESGQRRAEAWRDWLVRRDPLAIASLVLGVFSLIEFGALIIFGIAGAILGGIALRRLKRPETPTPRGHYLAWAGIVTSVLSLAVAAKFVYRWV